MESGRALKRIRSPKILIPDESSSYSESSKSENDDKMEQKEKSSTASKVYSSSNSKYNNSSDSSYVANCTSAKFLQQSVEGLTRGLDDMRVTQGTIISPIF